MSIVGGMKTLDTLLSDLKRLDPNGWATVTDGSEDETPESELIEVLREAIASIELENQID